MDSMRKSKEHFVEVPGGKVYVKTWSPRGGVRSHPIVLFHDSLGCVDLWRDFPSALCEKLDRTVIAYDRLGIGRSDKRIELPSVRFVEEEAEIYFPIIVNALRL